MGAANFLFQRLLMGWRQGGCPSRFFGVRFFALAFLFFRAVPRVLYAVSQNDLLVVIFDASVVQTRIVVVPFMLGFSRKGPQKYVWYRAPQPFGVFAHQHPGGC